ARDELRPRPLAGYLAETYDPNYCSVTSCGVTVKSPSAWPNRSTARGDRMSGTAAPPVSTRPGWVDWLFRRQLDNYPETRARVTYLAITVLATITLYYHLYARGPASP